MNIVVLDGYTENPGDLSWSALEAIGNLTVYDRTQIDNAQEIIQRIGDCEIVITNKTPITEQIINACPKMEFISILATGYNVVDCACASSKGIPVSNVPAYGTAAVSQYAIAMLLTICNRVAHHSEAVHEGRWEHSPDWCFWDYPQLELEGKVLGIIGFGNIGKRTGKIASALGMRVLACDTVQTAEGLEIADYVDLDTLLHNSDVIALHCPLFPETQGIINASTIAKMKQGVILLNNSRGQLVVEQDLADALNSGKVAGACVDVVSAEPINGNNPLLHAKNCFITPHISWAAKESRQRIMDSTVENVRAYLAGAPIHVVNR